MNRAQRLMRTRQDSGRVRNSELFFDLVYVFAITQLSHHLHDSRTWNGAFQTLVLFGAVWLGWMYTTWVTNWLDPDVLPTRLVLFAVMLDSLVLSVTLPRAFAGQGHAFAAAFVVMQVGRTWYMVFALRGHDSLRRNFQRILAWCVLSGAAWIGGSFAAGNARAGWWAAAIAVDMLGGALGFPTPGLGRSRTEDWTIAGNHLAERCQAFVLIALGESIVETGTTVSGFTSFTGTRVVSLVAAFVGAAALWWIYFDRSADAAASRVVASEDPGRLGRNAYHSVHPIMIAGIVAISAADELVINHPHVVGDPATAWLVLGGAGLFLAGHALFKLAIWRALPPSHLAGLAVLGLLGFAVPFVEALFVGVATTAVVAGVAVAARLVDARQPAISGR